MPHNQAEGGRRDLRQWRYDSMGGFSPQIDGGRAIRGSTTWVDPEYGRSMALYFYSRHKYSDLQLTYFTNQGEDSLPSASSCLAGGA
jgi:hypothetical protein